MEKLIKRKLSFAFFSVFSSSIVYKMSTSHAFKIGQWVMRLALHKKKKKWKKKIAAYFRENFIVETERNGWHNLEPGKKFFN